MATAKTGSFYLTESITLPGGTTTGGRVQGTLDLGAYVNVATGQAIAIEGVDFVYQSGATLSGNPEQMLTSAGSFSVQLTDLNPGTSFVRADNQSLIASGVLAIDQPNNIASHASDLFPSHDRAGDFHIISCGYCSSIITCNQIKCVINYHESLAESSRAKVIRIQITCM